MAGPSTRWCSGLLCIALRMGGVASRTHCAALRAWNYVLAKQRPGEACGRNNALPNPSHASSGVYGSGNDWQLSDTAVGFARAASVVPRRVVDRRPHWKVGLNPRAPPRSAPACEDLDLAASQQKAEYIIRLLGGLRPIGCRRGEEMCFQLVSTFASRLFIGFDVGKEPTGLSRILGRHAAVPVEIQGPVGHKLATRLDFQRNIAP